MKHLTKVSLMQVLNEALGRPMSRVKVRGEHKRYNPGNIDITSTGSYYILSEIINTEGDEKIIGNSIHESHVESTLETMIYLARSQRELRERPFYAGPYV